MIYLDEAMIPPQTSYVPMTPHQAVEKALKQGLCIYPKGFDCGRKIERARAVELEAELKKDAGAPLSFALMIKT